MYLDRPPPLLRIPPDAETASASDDDMAGSRLSTPSRPVPPQLDVESDGPGGSAPVQRSRAREGRTNKVFNVRQGHKRKRRLKHLRPTVSGDLTTEEQEFFATLTANSRLT